MRAIKDGQVIEDTWQRVSDGQPVPAAGDVLVPLSVWNTERQKLTERDGRTGVWLASDQTPDQIEALDCLALIAVDFPKYVDGRGYSAARLLRGRLKYSGELRAVGDVLHDQLFFMARCGFDSFVLKEGKDIDGAVAALRDFSVTYQGAADDERPLYRRVQR